jgi:hypothetical protein
MKIEWLALSALPNIPRLVKLTKEITLSWLPGTFMTFDTPALSHYFTMTKWTLNHPIPVPNVHNSITFIYWKVFPVLFCFLKLLIIPFSYSNLLASLTRLRRKAEEQERDWRRTEEWLAIREVLFFCYNFDTAFLLLIATYTSSLPWRADH